MRIGIIAFLHESNTFSSQLTDLEAFHQDLYVHGEELRSRLEGSHHEIGGFFAGVSDAGAEAVPLFAARALPSGTICADAFDAIVESIVGSIRDANNLDGILVAPHGATLVALAGYADGWLNFRARVRARRSRSDDK